MGRCLPPCLCLRFFLLSCRPPCSTLFPYTTLFRSRVIDGRGHRPNQSRRFLEFPLARQRVCALGLGFEQYVARGERDLLVARSEEHTSELQSQSNLVCRLLLEKKNRTINTIDLTCS